MKSAEIRSMFLDFYADEHGHTRMPSASLVPSSYDPSVLLTTAGMQPFKPFFLGQETPPSHRLTSCQKCFRTPDIDQVGLTDRHLTFFEMLGNFSFGDYFKQGAIEMAWEFVHGKLRLDAEKLWVTVHEGDEHMGLGPDEEAIELWKGRGVPAERIVQLGDDNFWKAGPTGPCGPCSEIYYDRGAEHGCGDADCKPGCDCDRYLEFYNLVFMQYDRDDAGKLTPLPSQNIDTGMGLERISALMQGNVSVFEIDSMRDIMAWAEKRGGVKYGADPAVTKALRVLADHGRGMTFLISDGVRPSNEGRGYVLRRVIRRAIQQADRIGLYNAGTGVLSELARTVTGLFGDAHPGLVENTAMIANLLDTEEERFLRTLSDGTVRLREVLDATAEGGTVSGDDAFQLHDTYGFPVELTEELAGERGLSVDIPRFELLMREQRERARAAAGGGSLPVEAAAAFVRTADASEFVGYSDLAIDTTIVALESLDDSRVMLKLAQSPFYAEGGGQVGDSGAITGSAGRATVEAVMRYDTDQVIVASVDGELKAGETVRAEVDVGLRRATESNHTATHLLHRALRDRLGEHVGQAGSLVAPDRLRFDFTHQQALTREDLDAISATVNQEIAAGDSVGWKEIGIDEARDAGAMMLFGEKYGDRVRMVDVGNGWSRELCGGTHVSSTGQIQLMVVTSEASVGAGVRRIEAVTGRGAIEWLTARANAAEAAAVAASTGIERLPDKVEELVSTNRTLEREVTKLRSGSVLDDALASATDADGIKVVAFRADALDGDELLDLSDRIKGKLGSAAVLLGAGSDGSVQLVANFTEDAVSTGLKAGDVIGTVAKLVGGGGGGRPNMARAGGKDVSKLDEALEVGRKQMVDALTGSATPA